VKLVQRVFARPPTAQTPRRERGAQGAEQQHAGASLERDHQSEVMAEQLRAGYVRARCGRRRRVPDVTVSCRGVAARAPIGRVRA
jgi:hypothetical protein